MGESATTAVATLDTAAVNEESRKETAEGVANSSNRLCSRDGNPCYCHRLEYEFFSVLSALFVCAVSLFSLSFSAPPPLSLIKQRYSSPCFFVREAVIICFS